MPTRNNTNGYKSEFQNNDGPSLPFQRISYAKKKAHDFRWAEQVADFYDKYYGGYCDMKRLKRLKINYNLYNGRGEQAMDEYKQDYHSELEMEGLGGFDDIQYHPVIDQVAKAMVGEMQRRPLKPIAIDSSGYTMNLRKMKRNEMFQSYIQQQILDPIRAQAFQSVMQRLGIQDPYALSPEEQQEMNFMVQEQAQSMTPSEIDNYMRKDYKSPTEMQAQKLVDFMMGDLDIKFVTDQGFKHAIISGEEIYYVSVRHGMPYLELVNPMGFTTSAANNTHFIEDGEFATYERNIKYTDMFNAFGDKFQPKDLKKIESAFQTTTGGGGIYDESHHARLVAEISRVDSVVEQKLTGAIGDIRTQEGQNNLKHLYSRFGSISDGYSSIRHTHIVWKGLRKLIYVTRATNQGTQNFWVDESYKFNKQKGDMKQDIIWVPEIWETDKLGTADAIYINKQPLPNQYRSLDDPWNVKLPYVGVQYGRLFGNAENVAPMDLGKPWQYKFNVQMAKIHEMEATDVGKVLLTTMGAKPEDWSWGKWIMMMKYGKIAPIDTTSESFNPGIDSQIFKSLDLSTLSDMVGRLQYLEFTRNQIALSMSYNPSRLGHVAPHAAVTNTQQSIVQSSYQTEDIYSTHNKVVENLLNALVRCARTAFRENDMARTYLLDDMSIAELELDWGLLDVSKIGVKIRNSSEDFNNIMNVKSVAQSMVQNGLITMPELIKLMWASNGAEILNIAEHAEEKAGKRREEEIAAQERLMEKQSIMAKELQELQQAFEVEKMDKQNYKDLLVAEITSTRFAQQHDINKNQLSDKYEIEKMKIQHEKIQKDRDRELDKEKHKDEMEIKRKDSNNKRKKETKSS